MEDTAPVLNAAEARLLGCLIEKEATTPETYPLTVNAAQAAANQKTAREPVMALDPGAVNHALRQLEQKGLAKQVFSSRAERYEHRTAAFFGIPQQQAVLLGLLLLRGAQTVHELLARSERLFKFNDADDVRHHLDRLIQGQPNRYKFEGATLFKFQVPMERPEERFNTLEALLERLAPPSA